MTYQAINNIAAIDLDSLDTPSATKEYPLATPIEINDTSKGQVSVFFYCKSHATLSAGQPVELVEGTGGDAEFVTVGITTIEDGQGVLIGFPTTDVTSGYYFWAQISGIITAKAGAFSAGDQITVLNGGTTVTEEDQTNRTAHTLGLAKTNTSGGLADIVIMPGRRIHVAAS
tara:strand:- start:99 stop:614 length:516 start_codon:yes stop_codon:yes gene_type:complete